MRRSRTQLATSAVMLALAASSLIAQDREPASILERPVPIGLDAFRQWERWPELRPGVRTYLRSTYDRRGGNEGADASHLLYQERDDFNVALDLEGPGLLCFVRTNHWHGSPWHYEVDGTDHVVSESSTADPLHPVAGSTFLPAEVFPEPLAFTWATTKGADLSWVPVPFTHSFRLAYGRTHYGTGYYIFQRFLPGMPLSRPLQTWDGEARPGPDVLALLRATAPDLVPAPGSPAGQAQGLREESGTVGLEPGRAVTLARWTVDQPSRVRRIEISAPEAQAVALGRSRVRITWDDRERPSVDAPTALFFGAGTLYNRDRAAELVRSFPCTIRFEGGRVMLACAFPMPFARSARVELIGPPDEAVSDVTWSVRWSSADDRPGSVGWFHATYRDHGPEPERGRDLTLLDTKAAEGEPAWTGHLVGTSFIFTDRGVLTTLEGDPRFYLDDARTPQVQGTGTEEWGGGGDYWGGRTMTLPFVGHPVGAKTANEAKGPEDLIHSAYRFLLSDLMPFGRRAVITLEHGGTNESTEHYRTVTYWYGAPGASLVVTDQLIVGDPKSEQAHGHSATGASIPYAITSRYEVGIDTLPGGREIVPTETRLARTTVETTEFTLRLDPDNRGVLLRRTLDHQHPNQRAEIAVADASDPGRIGPFEVAGTWFTAGSNTCVYSNPKDELGATSHEAQASNRRFREDEMWLPRGLTAGRAAVRVRVRPAPIRRPLFPGGPDPEPLWSEIDYAAECLMR